MIIPSGYGQVNLNFTGVGLPTGAQVTWGFERGDPDMTATEAADAIGTVIAASTIQANFSTAVGITSVYVKFGPNEDGPFGESPENIFGAVAQENDYPAASILIKKTTPFGGRKGAGRMFWPGVPATSTNQGGAVQGGVLTAIQTDLVALLTGLAAANVPMWLLHASAGTTPHPVTALTVQPVLATQRRRQRR